MTTRRHDLADTKQERLTESEDIRAKLAYARQEANRWPEVRHTSGPVAEIPELPFFRPSDDDGQAH